MHTYCIYVLYKFYVYILYICIFVYFPNYEYNTYIHTYFSKLMEQSVESGLFKHPSYLCLCLLSLPLSYPSHAFPVLFAEFSQDLLHNACLLLLFLEPLLANMSLQSLSTCLASLSTPACVHKSKGITIFISSKQLVILSRDKQIPGSYTPLPSQCFVT